MKNKNVDEEEKAQADMDDDFDDGPEATEEEVEHDDKIGEKNLADKAKGDNRREEENFKREEERNSREKEGMDNWRMKMEKIGTKWTKMELKKMDKKKIAT